MPSKTKKRPLGRFRPGPLKRFLPVRWALAQAASEFGINPKTIAQRVKAAGILPGRDGKFSTGEIARAIYGDIEGERLRKTKEEADKLALENEKTRGRLVEVEAVYKHFEGIFVSFRQRVLASGLADEEKDEILNDLRRLKARDISEPDSDRGNSRSALPDPGAPAKV